MTPLLTSASFFLAIFGFLTSWTYLRFYKTVFPDLDVSQPASQRGDASETFAFAEFFPRPVKPLVAGVSARVFDVLVAMRLCTPFSAADVSAARDGGGGSGGNGNSFLPRGVPGSARAEAERRRALALKALDQRLHAATANAAARAQQAPPPPAVQPPAPSATGPTVQSQPQAHTQAVMTSQPSSSGLRREASYSPDRSKEKGSA